MDACDFNTLAIEMMQQVEFEVFRLSVGDSVAPVVFLRHKSEFIAISDILRRQNVFISVQWPPPCCTQ